VNTQVIPTTTAELIPVTEHEGRQAVSLRDLHEFLQVVTHLKDWAPRMFAYGFTEGEDYVEVSLKNEQNHSGGRPSRNWAVSLDMAKELSMIQRTDRGKQARQYFIEVEKRARAASQVPVPRSLPEALRQYANEVEAHEATKAVVAIMQPKVAAWDSIVSSAGSWSYNDAAKVLCEEGQIDIGEKRLVRALAEWGYLYRDHKGRPHVYQRFLEQGLFAVKARTYEDKVTGEIKESAAPQVRITGRGLGMIRTRLIEQKEVA
jgi:phage anti-repressor protein